MFMILLNELRRQKHAKLTRR